MYITLDESDVYGTDYVGGIFGNCSSASSGGTFLRNYLSISSSDVSGNGNYLGGITGYLTRGNCLYWTVSKCNVTNNSVNSLYTGGAIGCGSFTWPNNGQVTNVVVDSKGSMVGGFIGNSANSDTAFSRGYIYNVDVTGENYVGGGFGRLDYGSIGNVYINANIKANGSYAGGAVGYMDNTNMTASRNAITIGNTIIVDTKVEASTKSGGLIGDIAKEIYRGQSFYYNNYVDADVTSENTSTGSLIIGGRPDENDYITNTYVYKYSTLNGNYVYATDDNIDNEQYLVRADLEQQNTFSNKVGLGTTYWNYASLTEGKYPKIKDSYLYKPELQTGVDLPTDPDITIINSVNSIAGNGLDNANGISTQSIETLPTVTAYPVSVNEINIDFSTVPEKISFTYCVNGQEKDTIELTQKTYTFRYNYQDTIEIKLTNEENKTTSDENGKTITITPNDVRSEASLVGGNNAYLLGTNLYVNGELQQGEYVNVYEGYALRRDGTVINIATGENVENTGANSSNNVNSSQTYIEQDKETYLEQTPKPLHIYEYKGNTIEVYGTYSKVNGNIKLQVYNVRSGKLSALSNSLDMKIGNSITDNYNNKEYQTILNTLGELVDLKEMLKYPDNFLTRNIKQIVQNTDEEKTEVMVLYSTGKVVVFNYVSGEVIYETNEKADEGLTDYIAGSIENIWNDYEEKRQEYEKSKELEQKLISMPIEKAIEEATGMTSDKDNQGEKINVSNNSYISVYNAETGKYEVYSENEILEGSDETPVSETEKITQNGLEGIYGYNAKEETKPQTNGAIIVIAIIAITIIALVVLRRVIVKNNTKKKR